MDFRVPKLGDVTEEQLEAVMLLNSSLVNELDALDTLSDMGNEYAFALMLISTVLLYRASKDVIDADRLGQLAVDSGLDSDIFDKYIAYEENNYENNGI